MKDWEYWKNYHHFKIAKANMEWVNEIDENENISPIEKIAMLAIDVIKIHLGKVKFKCTHQKPIGKYIADFVLEYEGVSIVIECDGHEFHEKTKEQVEKDKKRDRFFTVEGYKILRYSGAELVKGFGKVIYDVMQIYEPEYHEKMFDIKGGKEDGA